jgi:3-carboxy-cis,cis-muconate cycloisomerase
MVVASLSKIANEVAILMRTEVDELREPFSPGRGGSTTMPQKRNPISCPIIMAIGTRMREFTGIQLAAMVQEHERSVDGQSLEWLIIPDVFLLASGSLKHSKEMIDGIFVNEEQMLHNLGANDGILMAESVMMGIAPNIGRKEAHELVKGASDVSILENISLKEALLRQDVVKEHLSLDQLDELLDPLNYTGCADKMISRVLDKI